MQTWGISGPQFLLIYGVLLAVTALLVAAAQRRVIAATTRWTRYSTLTPTRSPI